MSIRIPIITDFSDAGVKSASKSLGDLQSKAKSLGASLPAIGVAFAAIGGAAVFLTKAVQAAAEDQKSQALLAAQLKKTLNANDLLIGSMEKFVSTAQLATGVADTDLRSGLETLVRATGSATQAQNLLTLAMDISAATGKDLDSVTIALAKAANGNTAALQKLGIPLDQTALKTKDLTALTKSLNQTFGGAAATAANTFSGKIKILKGQMGEIIETIGAALLPYLDKFAGFLVRTVAPAVERITRVIGQYGLAAGFQQLVFESGKAGPAIIKTVRGVTVAFANLVNVVYKGVQIQIAQFKLLTGDLGGALEAIKNATRNFIDVGALEKAFDSIAFGFNYAGTSALDLAASLDGLGSKVLPKVVEVAGGLPPVLNNAAKAADTMKQKIDAVRKELDSKFSKALDDATAKLQKAKDAYNSFATDISSSLTGNTSFSAVYEAGKETGQSFIDGLKDQSATVKQFSQKIQILLQNGLSEKALRQVLDAGLDAGSAIADQLILGGSDAIKQTNDLLQSLQDLANSVGKEAADNFYLAGVTQGEALVAGIESVIANYQGILKNPNLTLEQLLNLSDQFGTDQAFMDITGATDIAAPSAEGLSASIGGFMAQRQVGMAQQGYTINVNGGLDSSAAIGQAVVNAIRSFNRTNGPAQIAVSSY
jgi:hypothetical protein